MIDACCIAIHWSRNAFSPVLRGTRPLLVSTVNRRNKEIMVVQSYKRDNIEKNIFGRNEKKVSAHGSFWAVDMTEPEKGGEREKELEPETNIKKKDSCKEGE